MNVMRSAERRKEQKTVLETTEPKLDTTEPTLEILHMNVIRTVVGGAEE